MQGLVFTGDLTLAEGMTAKTVLRLELYYIGRVEFCSRNDET